MEISSFHVRKCVLAATLPNVKKVDCAKTALKDSDKSFDACLIIKFKNRTELAGLNMWSKYVSKSPKRMRGHLYTKKGALKPDTRVKYSTVPEFNEYNEPEPLPLDHFKVRFHMNCSQKKAPVSLHLIPHNFLFISVVDQRQ